MTHRYISLGSGCDVAMMLDILKLREEAYPFDWLWNLNDGLRAVNEILESRFAQILDEDAYYSGKHQRFDRDVVLYKSLPSIIHLHSNPLKNPVDHQMLVRRISRFNRVLRGKDKLHFIHYENLNEKMRVDRTLSVENMLDALIAQGKHFMSFMSRKGHGKRTTLLLVVQADAEFEPMVTPVVEGADTRDERVRIGFTISRDDSSPALLSLWRKQWLDVITTKTNMPEDMIALSRLQLKADLPA